MANQRKAPSKRPARKITRQVTPTTSEVRHKLISEAAYYLSEQHGFEEKYQLHDWLEAEAKIDRIYGKSA